MLIRSDGSAVACGGEDPEHAEQCNIPASDTDMHYAQGSAGSMVFLNRFFISLNPFSRTL